MVDLHDTAIILNSGIVSWTQLLHH
jgi:hypothetical protein